MSYVLEGYKWTSSPVTWSFSDLNITTVSPQYSGYTAFDATFGNTYRATIEKAFSVWSSISGIKFQEVQDSASNNIRVGIKYIDGYASPGGSSTLALTQTWSSSGSASISEILFDNDSFRTQSGSPDLTTLNQTAVHEIGHAIGLDHSPSPSDVMYYLNQSQNSSGTLSSNDIAGAQFLYGAATVNLPPVVAAKIGDKVATEGKLFTVTIPSNTFTDANGDTLTKTAAWLNNGVATALPSWLSFNGTTGVLSGTPPTGAPDVTIQVTANDGNGGSVSTNFQITTPAPTPKGTLPSSFDPLQYLAANPDLINAFSANQSAAIAHYLNYGTNEDRSTTFNAAEYEASNADLISAFGSNITAALQHYIIYGYKEGRSMATFDGAAYLVANPDVAKAGYTADTAAQHYVAFGYNEHRSLLSTTKSSDVVEGGHQDVPIVGIATDHTMVSV